MGFTEVHMLFGGLFFQDSLDPKRKYPEKTNGVIPDPQKPAPPHVLSSRYSQRGPRIAVMQELASNSIFTPERDDSAAASAIINS